MDLRGPLLITAAFSSLLAIWLWHKDVTRPRMVSITNIESVSSQGCSRAASGPFVAMGCALRGSTGAKFTTPGF